MAKVTIVYFKQSGKYHATGDYETEKTALHHVVKEVESMFRDGINPGLQNYSSRNKNKYDAMIEVFGVPFLIKASDSLDRLIVE